LKAGLQQSFHEREPESKRLERKPRYARCFNARPHMKMQRIQISQSGLHHRLRGPDDALQVRL
jgi:hypothetical protein